MLAMVLYGYTVRLPFFLDDGPNFWFLDHINGLQQWGGSLGFPYYRTIAFTLWKLAWAMLGGRYDPALMHLLNVFCFGLAGVLVGLLASRLAPPEFNKRFGLLAGLSVVLFPFSYQAVTLVSGLFHLTLLLGFAISLWAAMHWLDARGGRLALVLCWLGAFFGVFSHENGPLLLPLAIGMVVLVYGVRSLVRSRTLLVIVPVGVISLLYLFLWATLPLGRGLLQFTAEPIRAFSFIPWTCLRAPLSRMTQPTH